MKEIKFTTNYEPVLSMEDKDFKKKYEKRIGESKDYIIRIDDEKKHMAVCPRCNNPVVILGIYKQLKVSPHARHAKDVSLPGIAEFNRYKFERCPNHKKKADYIKEYVPETEEPERKELYKIAKEHFDKAIYLLQKTTGLYITKELMDSFAENYAAMRVYNYIDATLYNIPWYLIYSHVGIGLNHQLVKKNSCLYKRFKKLGMDMRDSFVKDHVYIQDNNGYALTATNYRYSVDKNDHLNEWLDFSVVIPDDDIEDVLLFKGIDDFSIKVDSYYFGNLVFFKDWKPRQDILDIAKRYMNP